MKLLYILAAILAISLAEITETFEDSQAEASEDIVPAASSYSYGQQAPSAPKPWESTYVPASQNGYYTSQTTQQNTWNNQQNKYNTQNNAPQNTYNPPQNTYNPPQNTYNPPQNNYNQAPYYPSNIPQNTNNQNQNIYNNQNTWQKPTPAPITTTPIAVIKNEQVFGENGSYKYEYEIADGTHVSEEGYFLNPNTEQETLVKKGWYSYTGADGKIYTVTYWADDTGFHATGDHLPKPPPIPPAIQASIDQNAKEEAAKAEAEKNKPQQGGGYNPIQQQPPRPIQPQQPAPIKPTPPSQQYPPQQYPQEYPQQYPNQQYPAQQYPSQQYPSQQYPTQQYPTQQYPSQQYPSQQYPQPSYPSSSGYGK